MIRTALSLLLLTLLPVVAGEPIVAFQRGAEIFLTDLTGQKPRKVATGDWPDISPDGTRLAYNIQGGEEPARQLAVLDVASGKETPLRGIPSDNCYGPAWSPDGKTLVFQIMQDGNWHLGLVDADGKNFRFLRRAASVAQTLYGAIWAPDGQSFYAHDLDGIQQLGLDGKVLREWKLTDLVGDQATFNSGCKLSISPDGRTLLFDADMNEEVRRKGWEGPPASVWKLDLAAGKATRLTPKGVMVWEPCWISAEEFLGTTTAKAAGDARMLKRWKIAGGEPLPVVTDAGAPSISRPTAP